MGEGEAVVAGRALLGVGREEEAAFEAGDDEPHNAARIACTVGVNGTTLY